MEYLPEQWKYFQDRTLFQIFATQYAKNNGLMIVAKECLRTLLQAWANSLPADSTIEARTTTGVTMDFIDKVGGVGKSQSQHLKALADDYIMFKDGKDITSVETMKPLGDYWKSLDPLNRWGGEFVHPRPDPYHMERNV